MTDQLDAGRMLESAERAASGGDLASAEELLRKAARLQESQLGPLHPDLANTLNNLAIVMEKTERLSEAEAFYRRGSAIASAALPSDHPMVAASRQNLEDFCRARGLPIEVPAPVVASARQTAPATAPPPHPKRWASLGSMLVGGIVLVAGMALVWRLLSPRETPTPISAPEAAPPRAAEPAPSPPPAPPAAAPLASPASVERPQQPTVAPPGDDPAGRRIVPSAGAVTLVTAELCQSFATSGDRWRCDPAGDAVSQGSLVLYTRVRSPRDAEVIHQWYRGDALRQSTRLTTRTNATEGYRTYSRQTVGSGEDWRVEVRSASGELLYEQRFVVR
jgi:hypothetical protein